MDRLRELRGPDTRERDLANILGFEHSRAVRWKEGQMYVDRAEYLMRLADALDLDTMLLVQIASGNLPIDQAQKLVHRAGTVRPVGDEHKKRKLPAAGQGGAIASRVTEADLSADAAQYATDAARFESATRAVVLLVAADGVGRSELAESLSRHVEVGGLVATGLVVGVALAERYRPELVFLDLGVANVHAFDAVRFFASLASRAGRRCRVVAGTSNVTDAVEKPALMAGAANVALFPFAANLIGNELDRLEERLGARRAARR